MTKKLDGPGKLCKFLGIDKSHNSLDAIYGSEMSFHDVNIKIKFTITPRIGISSAKEKLWRFVVQDYWLPKN